MPSEETKQAQINPQLASIQQQLQTLLSNESAAKKSFQGLYEELEAYKNDFLFRHERVLLQDLLLFYDSLLWFTQEAKSNPDKASDYAQYLIDEFLEVLRRRDVLPIEPHDKFDRKYHRIISTEETEDESKERCISEVHRRGFHRGEQIVRAEEVVIYRYSKKETKGEEKGPGQSDSEQEQPVAQNELKEAGENSDSLNAGGAAISLEDTSSEPEEVVADTPKAAAISLSFDSEPDTDESNK